MFIILSSIIIDIAYLLILLYYYVILKKYINYINYITTINDYYTYLIHIHGTTNVEININKRIFKIYKYINIHNISLIITSFLYMLYIILGTVYISATDNINNILFGIYIFNTLFGPFFIIMSKYLNIDFVYNLSLLKK